MPDMAWIAKRLRPGGAAQMFAPPERDVRPGLFIFEHIAPDARHRITSQPQLRHVAPGRIQEKKIPESAGARRIADHLLHPIRFYAQPNDFVLIPNRKHASRPARDASLAFV